MCVFTGDMISYNRVNGQSVIYLCSKWRVCVVFMITIGSQSSVWGDFDDN